MLLTGFGKRRRCHVQCLRQQQRSSSSKRQQHIPKHRTVRVRRACVERRHREVAVAATKPRCIATIISTKRVVFDSTGSRLYSRRTFMTRARAGRGQVTA